MEGNYTDYAYDAQGNLTTMSYKDPAGTESRKKAWSYQHPTYPGLLWKEILANGSSTEWTYSDAGTITSIKDPNGNVTSYGYDPLNRLTTVTQPGSIITRYNYDRQGNLVSVTDPGNRQTTYSFDDMGRVVAVASPDSGTSTYVYDEAGNLRFKTDANGITVETTYDALNRPVSVGFPAHGNLTAFNLLYTYDQRENGKGHLTDIVDPSGTTALNYDARGRLDQKIATIGGTAYLLSRELTPGGRLLSTQYPSGRTLDFVRTGCPCKITGISTTFNGTTTNVLDLIDYGPTGESTGMTFGELQAGASVEKVFDLDGRLTVANPGEAFERNFTYDNVGHLKSSTLKSSTLNPTALAYFKNLYERTFDYDTLNRLKSGKGPFGTIAYTYDGAGNLLSEVQGSQTLTHSYIPSTNRLSGTTGGTPLAYAHDASGNITGINTRTLVYNQDNRLVRVEDGASVLGEYGYNAFGQRTSKSVGDTTTQ